MIGIWERTPLSLSLGDFVSANPRFGAPEPAICLSECSNFGRRKTGTSEPSVRALHQRL